MLQSTAEECGICKEETKCDFVTRCGHWFHENCLKTWFARQNSCPYCKQRVSLSKMKEKICWNLKKLKTIEAKKTEAMDFFESNIEDLDDTVPSYDPDIIKILQAAGWDINDNEAGASNLVLRACEIDDIYRLNFLFESGLKLMKDSALHREALEVAEENSSNLVLKRIEQYFSTTFIKRAADGSTPLHEACANDKFSTVKSLVEAGAPVNARNKLGARPLHFACSSAHIKVINYLIEKGAEINCVDLNGRSPLYEAVLSKSLRKNVLERFLELKASLTYLDQERNNLLHVALIAQKFESAKILVDHIEDINALNCFGETVLHIAADLAPLSLIERLIERGCDAKLKDSEGNTALHRAVASNSVEVVAALLKDKRSDVNAVDANNRTPLFLAMKRAERSEFVQVLTDHEADLNIRDKDGRTVLNICLENLHLS